MSAGPDLRRRLRAAYDRVLFDALLRSERLFVEHATPEECERELRLLKLARSAPDGSRHRYYLELLILERGIESRRDAEAKRRAKNFQAAAAIEAEYTEWSETARSIRSTLDQEGLDTAWFELRDGQLHISIESRPGNVLRDQLARVVEVIGDRLKPFVMPRTWFSIWEITEGSGDQVGGACIDALDLSFGSGSHVEPGRGETR